MHPGVNAIMNNSGSEGRLLYSDTDGLEIAEWVSRHYSTSSLTESLLTSRSSRGDERVIRGARSRWQGILKSVVPSF